MRTLSGLFDGVLSIAVLAALLLWGVTFLVWPPDPTWRVVGVVLLLAFAIDVGWTARRWLAHRRELPS
jgi:hypothetical protein